MDAEASFLSHIFADIYRRSVHVSNIIRPQDYKTFFMLNSAEHEFFLLIQQSLAF